MKAKPNYKRSERVAVTFRKETLQVLNQLSFMTGNPKAALVSELVDAALPALVETVEALRIVKEQPKEAERLLARFGAEAVRDLMQSQLDLGETVDKRTLEGKRAARRQRATTTTP